MGGKKYTVADYLIVYGLNQRLRAIYADMLDTLGKSGESPVPVGVLKAVGIASQKLNRQLQRINDSAGVEK